MNSEAEWYGKVHAFLVPGIVCRRELSADIGHHVLDIRNQLLRGNYEMRLVLG